MQEFEMLEQPAGLEVVDLESDPRLLEIEAKMLQHSTLIDALTQSLYHQTTEADRMVIRERIEVTKQALERLWQQQAVLEQEGRVRLALSPLKRCA